MISRFCVQQTLSSPAKPISADEFTFLLTSPGIKSICAQIKDIQEDTVLSDQEKADMVSKIKKKLPAITPFACEFVGGKRSNANAIPSGLIMIDIDHIPDPHAIFEAINTRTLSDNRVYAVHITPSGHGLRFIAEQPQGTTIEEAMVHLCEAIFDQEVRAYSESTGLSFGYFDPCTKDLARLSFLVPNDYFLWYYEDGLFFADNQARTDHIAAHTASPTAASGESTAANGHESAAPKEASITASDNLLNYGSVPYSLIVQSLIDRLGGTPVEGERNNMYFTLAHTLRYICDFSVDRLLAIIPDFGLALEERRAVCASAIRRTRKNTKPELLEAAIEEATRVATIEDSLTAAGDAAEYDAAPPRPVLPPALRPLFKRLPSDMFDATLVASMVALGALATGYRFRYLDGQVHSFSLQGAIAAPAASGKSYVTDTAEILLRPLRLADDEARAYERKYKDELRAAKNAKKQPEYNPMPIRIIPPATSIAEMLRLMDLANGKHLITICPELDTVIKSERAGVWSQKSDIERNAFDNAIYGQQYRSDNSYSASLPVYWNTLYTGTIDALYRKYADIENGLITRVMFVVLKDMFAAKLPTVKPLTDDELNALYQLAERLMMGEGDITQDNINKAMSAWVEQKRLDAIAANSRAIDTFRKRAAVIGARIGHLIMVVRDHTRADKFDINWALYAADLTFRNQMMLFGDEYEAKTESQMERLSRGSTKRTLLQDLPDEFTKADLRELRAAKHKSTKSNTLSKVISRWLDAGMITQTEDGKYRKV